MNPRTASFLINPSSTVKNAMKQLDKTAEKILFVTDNMEKLIGTLSDGDIRRWILAEGSLDKPVTEVCNSSPVVMTETFTPEEIKQVMLKHKIECVPILDSTGKILDLKFWEDIFGGEEEQPSKEYGTLTCPVVIMAGGKGTRLDPFTRILPKPLIPIGNKPIIEIIIDKFLPYEIDEFYISVNHKSKIIKSFFEELDPDYRLGYLEESKPLGTGGALKFLDGRVDGAFFVTNCDIIVECDYEEIFKFHRENKNAITIIASMKHFNIPYGVCEIFNGGSLLEMKEKPEFSFLVNTGMYVVESDILSLIPEDTFFHFTHLIDAAKEKGMNVKVFPISENSWIDTGEWDEYRKAIEMIKV